jgi:transcriptional regulator with XRE-family HTH domain
MPRSRIHRLLRLGVVLEMARKAAGYTQEQAALEMGVNPAAFTRWEAGKNGVSAYDLARLIRLFGFDADLALNPPASKLEIRRRLGRVAAAVRRGSRRGQTRRVPRSLSNGTARE